MSIIIGVAVMVIGGIGFWQREKISQLNRSQNKRLGKYGDLMTGVGTAKYFGIGALFMILAGAAIVIYSLVTGRRCHTLEATSWLNTGVASGS